MRCFRMIYFVRELCEVANDLLLGESRPELWKRSIIVPFYKGKGNVLECGNYCTIKLLEHGLKLEERVFEKRFREMAEIRKEQYGFVAGKWITDVIFMLKQLQRSIWRMTRTCIWCL